MECNKRNRNIRYAIFRDSNLNRISNVFAKSNEIVFYMNGELFRKLQRFFGPIFYIFGRFVKTKCRTFLRMAQFCLLEKHVNKVSTLKIFNNLILGFLRLTLDMQLPAGILLNPYQVNVPFLYP